MNVSNLFFSWNNSTDRNLNSTEISSAECRKRACACDNGKAVDGSSCDVHRKRICAYNECHVGYNFNSSTELCDANICDCDYGEGSEADSCPEYGGSGCENCFRGYHNETSEDKISQKCVLNTCECDDPALSGTEGTACEKNGEQQCQPEKYVKEFCFQRCLENYSEKKSEFIRISREYLSDCEKLNSLENTKECMIKVQHVCNTRCFHYGQTELKEDDVEIQRNLLIGSNELQSVKIFIRQIYSILIWISIDIFLFLAKNPTHNT